MTVKLPFDKNCPVFYDNDDHRDVYTDEYLMALAHNGEIELKGIITTYSANREEYDLFIKGREKIVALARKTGMKNIPDALTGSAESLSIPESLKFEETEPFNLSSTEKLVAAARQATPEKPLVVITGGQLTALADAYLLAPDIADKIVVCGVFGTVFKDHNSALDSWAWTIVLSKFQVVAIPILCAPGKRADVYQNKAPHVPKEKIKKELPQEIKFFKWLYEKEHPTNELPDEHDYDGHPVVALMQPDYIKKVKRWRPVGIDKSGEARLVADDQGPIIEVIDASKKVATEHFWLTMYSLAEDIR